MRVHAAYVAVVALSVVAWSVVAWASAECRNVLRQPFASDSVWNTPIGSAAQFRPAYLYSHGHAAPRNFHNDQEFFVVPSITDPMVPWLNQGWWGARNHCDVVQRTPATYLQLPANWTTASDGGRSPAWQANNNPAAVLLPNTNGSIVQMQPAYRCGVGASQPLLARWGNATDGCPQQFPNVTSLYGDGRLGAHGGSGLSALGGSIRVDELGSHPAPIAHALKLELHAAEYYYGQTRLQPVTAYNGGRTQYVWPATGSDSGSSTVPGGLYNGTLPYLAPGSLLAIPPSIASSVHTSTVPGTRIKQALTDFGGYLVDDTGSPTAAICMQAGVNAEMRARFGYTMTYPHGVTATGPGAALYADLLAIFRSLHVVVNNGPHSIGGGGDPVALPPLPLCPA